MMKHARLNVGLEGVAISERAYQQARQYALDRVQGRTLGREHAPSATIIGHPDVRRMLMDMKARVEAMRALAYYTAGQMEHLSDARITTIYEGTTGIQANDLIGRKLARDSGSAMNRLIAMMGDDLDTASAAGGPSDTAFAGIAAALRTGLRALSEATDWLLTAPAREAAAGAVPYLKLCGTVIAG